MDELPSSIEVIPKSKSATKDPYASLPYRYLMFGSYFDLDGFKKHMLLIHKGLQYAIKNLKSPSEKFIRSKQVALTETSTSKPLSLNYFKFV